MRYPYDEWRRDILEAVIADEVEPIAYALRMRRDLLNERYIVPSTCAWESLPGWRAEADMFADPRALDRWRNLEKERRRRWPEFDWVLRPLQVACLFGRLKALEYLVRRGADLAPVVGMQPAEYNAVPAVREAIAEIIARKEADVKSGALLLLTTERPRRTEAQKRVVGEERAKGAANSARELRPLPTKYVGRRRRHGDTDASGASFLPSPVVAAGGRHGHDAATEAEARRGGSLHVPRRRPREWNTSLDASPAAAAGAPTPARRATGSAHPVASPARSASRRSPLEAHGSARAAAVLKWAEDFKLGGDEPLSTSMVEPCAPRDVNGLASPVGAPGNADAGGLPKLGGGAGAASGGGGGGGGAGSIWGSGSDLGSSRAPMALAMSSPARAAAEARAGPHTTAHLDARTRGIWHEGPAGDGTTRGAGAPQVSPVKAARGGRRGRRGNDEDSADKRAAEAERWSTVVGRHQVLPATMDATPAFRRALRVIDRHASHSGRSLQLFEGDEPG